ncbi:MAG: imidazoleglycerol-phosphate dehydratase HisB [Clostridia bacterium]|nr:imidazoleglycerol-phosphate dehydratase HisB [Clostridia bacterium]
MRQATITRKTRETDVVLTLNLDGEGKSEINTGVGFLDHMLTLFAAHSGYDLSVRCIGDTEVDDHHSVEDIGIALGQAFAEALGDKVGIYRYGYMILPMDESLILSAVDLSGRAHLSYSLAIPSPQVGTFDTELVEEFFVSFVRNAAVTLHLRKMAGTNSHHIIEGAFKAFARAMKKATAIDVQNADKLPSTKGVL